jgi:plastocyanin
MHRLHVPWGRIAITALLTGTMLVGQKAPAVVAATSTVSIIEPTDNENDYAFEQPSITVAAGDTVTWLNSGLEIHTVTADAAAFDSKDIDAGKSWSYTFASPGVYTYYCDPHPWMTGTVIVQ